MRWAWALLLVGCVASEAAPPFVGGGSAPAAAAEELACGDDCSLADCLAEPSVFVGAVCKPHDSPYLLRANAGVWKYEYPGAVFWVTPPPSDGWTARNSASVSVVGGTRRNLVAVSTTGYRLESRAAPATPYYVEMCFTAPHYGANQLVGGWFQSSDSKFIVFGQSVDSDIVYQDWTNYTTFSASNGGGTVYPLGGIWCIRLEDTGAVRRAYTGDGVSWMQVGADDTRTTFITADEIHWGLSANTAVSPTSLTLFHYETGTP